MEWRETANYKDFSRCFSQNFPLLSHLFVNICIYFANLFHTYRSNLNMQVSGSRKNNTTTSKLRRACERLRDQELKPFKTSVPEDFFPIRSPIIWNRLPRDVVNSNSVNIFKKRLDKHWETNPVNRAAAEGGNNFYWSLQAASSPQTWGGTSRLGSTDTWSITRMDSAASPRPTYYTILIDDTIDDPLSWCS